MLEGKKVNVRSGGDFDPIPMDKYTVQIIDVNLVMQFNNFIGKEEEVLNYQFQILDDKPMPIKEGEKEAQSTRGKYLWKRVRPVVNNRSWLGKLGKAVIGRELTKEEIADFDVESVVGKQVDVMIEHSVSKDGEKTFSNIISFNKTLKPLKPIEDKNASGKQTTVEKSTAPAEAPADEDDPDKLIEDLEEESKAAESEGSDEDAELAAAEAEAAELEAAAKAAAAKAKAAKLKAAAKK